MASSDGSTSFYASGGQILHKLDTETESQYKSDMAEADKPETREARARPIVRVIDTRELFGESTEVRLHHRGEEYRLRITKQGKLILTK
jgi:hemin uptake protein HemP